MERHARVGSYYLAAPLVAWLVRSGTGLLAVAAAAWLGLHYGTDWSNPHPAALPIQLPLFLVGIGSYHYFAYRTAAGEGRRAASTVPAAVLLLAAAVGGWNTVALGLWALAFGSVFARGNDPLALLLRGVRGILCHRVLQGLGKVSFPLYLLHWPLTIFFLHALLRVRPDVTSGQATAVMVAVGLPLMLLAALLVHKAVEAPGMALGRRLARRLAPRPWPAPSVRFRGRAGGRLPLAPAAGRGYRSSALARP